MIDEELYRKAADELNSEHRRPHIWARACALANDDHDEARYLYTNLRVEELLAEQSDGGVVAEGRGADEADDIPLALEPVVPEPGSRGADPAAGGLDDDERIGESVGSMPAGSDARSVPFPPGAFDEGTLRPTSERKRAVLDLDEGATFDLAPSDVTGAEDASRTAASADAGRGPADEDDVGEASDATADGDGDARDVPVLSNVTDEVEDAFWSEAEDGDDGRTVATIDGPIDGPTDGSIDDREHVGTDVDVLAAPKAPSSGALDDLDWLDEAYREERRMLSTPPAAADDADDDELTRELRRQVEELPGGRGSASVIAYDESPPAVVAPEEDGPRTDAGVAADAPPMPRAARDEDARGEPGFVDAAGPALATPPDTSPVAHGMALDAVPPGSDDSARRPEPVSGPMSDPADDFAFGATMGGDPPSSDAPPAGGDEPLELVDDGAGDEEYAVFSRDGKRWQAVRQGGSWGAMLLTLPWLVHRHLVGTAVLYALLAATVLLGLAVTGFAWHDAGTDASLVTRGAAIGFAVLAVVGLFVVPFRSANHWREDKLERRGFELVAYVRARGASRALELARRSTSGTT